MELGRLTFWRLMNGGYHRLLGPGTLVEDLIYGRYIAIVFGKPFWIVRGKGSMVRRGRWLSDLIAIIHEDGLNNGSMGMAHGVSSERGRAHFLSCELLAGPLEVAILRL